MTGMYFEDLSKAGTLIEHSIARTVTEADNVLFNAITMNQQPLHLDATFAEKTEFGQRLVNGLYTMALVVGLTVNDLTSGTIVANLGYESVLHPRPVFHGDTIRVVTEVLSARESASKPDRGIVQLKHRGLNQRDETVCELTRTVMFLKRPRKEGGSG